MRPTTKMSKSMKFQILKESSDVWLFSTSDILPILWCYNPYYYSNVWLCDGQRRRARSRPPESHLGQSEERDGRRNTQTGDKIQSNARRGPYISQRRQKVLWYSLESFCDIYQQCINILSIHDTSRKMKNKKVHHPS